MKKTLSLVLIALISGVLSSCTLFQNNQAVSRPSDTTATSGQQVVVVTPDTTTPISATLPSTTALATDPATKPTETAAPATTTPKTKPATKPAATKPPATKPVATKPPATKPIATKPPATTPPGTETPATKPPATQTTIQSNIPKNIKAAVDQSNVGFVLIYRTINYEGIVASTAWSVGTLNTDSQLFLVTKKKGSLVQVYDTKLTEGKQERVINNVIRSWTTTQDYQVIRIRHTDPETMALNFIKVTEPGGKKTTTEIKSKMSGLPNWESIKYD